MKNKSFTLIELLVVIAIIGLLASIVIVNLRGTRSKANIARGLHFSQSVHHALGAYAVGVWSFDEGSGTTANDSSGYGNNGTLANGPVWRCASTDPNYTPSGQGCSLYFDGENDYVDCGNDASLNITDAITVSAWVKPTAVELKEIFIISKASAYFLDAMRSWSLYPHFYIYPVGASANAAGSNTKLTAGTWNHLVGTYNSADKTIRIYLNGKQTGVTVLADNYKISTSGITLRVGSSYGTNYFNGIIDEVRIYNQELSEAEIQKHYAEGIKRHELAFYEK